MYGISQLDTISTLGIQPSLMRLSNQHPDLDGIQVEVVRAPLRYEGSQKGKEFSCVPTSNCAFVSQHENSSDMSILTQGTTCNHS
jgi:hypothetical protein